MNLVLSACRPILPRSSAPHTVRGSAVLPCGYVPFEQTPPRVLSKLDFAADNSVQILEHGSHYIPPPPKKRVALIMLIIALMN